MTKERVMRFVQARGSFYEVALQVGEECRSDIPEVYNRGMEYLLKHTMVGHGMQIEKRRSLIHDRAQFYLRKGEEIWKPSGIYLRAQAKGASVDESVIAVTSFTEEVSSEAGIIPPDKCSTWVGRFSDGAIRHVHNEDFEEHNRSNMVLLDVVFDGFLRSVGLTYSGQLFNLAGSLNAARIGITNNGFHPLAQPGWPKQVLHCRASLTQSMRGAKTWLSLQPNAVTTGYVVVCGRTGEAVSLMVSNLKTAKLEMDLLPIQDVFYCTNHVPPGRLGLHLPDPAIAASPNSFERYDVLANFKPNELPKNLQEGIYLFANHPVLFRKAGASVTLATVAMCATTGEFLVYDADPSAQKRYWPFYL